MTIGIMLLKLVGILILCAIVAAAGLAITGQLCQPWDDNDTEF